MSLLDYKIHRVNSALYGGMLLFHSESGGFDIIFIGKIVVRNCL